MVHNPQQYQSMPLGVVVRRSPGVTRWAKWSWRAVAVLPGAGEADWKILREQDGVAEFHVSTNTLELHGAECEAYLANLADATPSVYVVMRQTDDAQKPYKVLLVTASPYEGQYYGDGTEELVDKVPMPAGLLGWVRDFTDKHYEEEVFVKRRRDKKRIDAVDAGIGDPRIAQLTDVYRAPTRKEPVT